MSCVSTSSNEILTISWICRIVTKAVGSIRWNIRWKAKYTCWMSIAIRTWEEKDGDNNLMHACYENTKVYSWIRTPSASSYICQINSHTSVLSCIWVADCNYHVQFWKGGAKKPIIGSRWNNGKRTTLTCVRHRNVPMWLFFIDYNDVLATLLETFFNILCQQTDTHTHTDMRALLYLYWGTGVTFNELSHRFFAN